VFQVAHLAAERRQKGKLPVIVEGVLLLGAASGEP